MFVADQSIYRYEVFANYNSVIKKKYKDLQKPVFWQENEEFD